MNKKLNQGKDGAVYTRQQEGKSLTKWIIISLLTGGMALPWVIYWSVSPRFFWHT